MAQYPMSQYVVQPKNPCVYNWKTKEYEWLSPEEYQHRRDRQHQAEEDMRQSAGTAQNTQDTTDDTETPTLDRVPISTGEAANTSASDAYIKEILITDKELQTNQVDGADTVIQQQEEAAATILTPTIQTKTEDDDEKQQYEPPTEDDIRTAEALTKQAVPVISSASKHITPQELHKTATTYLSQPHLDQGKYDSRKFTDKVDDAPKGK